MFWHEPLFRRATHSRTPTRLADVFQQLWPTWSQAGWCSADGAPSEGRAETAADRVQPGLNVWRHEDRLRVAVLLPGVSGDAVDLTVEQDRLTIRAGRRLAATADSTTPAATEGGAAPTETAEPQLLRRERAGGEFERQLQLPFPVEAKDISAKMHHGVLWIDLPRAAADKPRKIEVRPAQG